MKKQNNKLDITETNNDINVQSNLNNINNSDITENNNDINVQSELNKNNHNNCNDIIM